jgi:hypothetical protein
MPGPSLPAGLVEAPTTAHGPSTRSDQISGVNPQSLADSTITPTDPSSHTSNTPNPQSPANGTQKSAKPPTKSSSPRKGARTKNTKASDGDWDGLDDEEGNGKGLCRTLPPLSQINEIFDDLTSKAIQLQLGNVINHLGGRPLRVATMCSGTESPLLALTSIKECACHLLIPR